MLLQLRVKILLRSGPSRICITAPVKQFTKMMLLLAAPAPQHCSIQQKGSQQMEESCREKKSSISILGMFETSYPHLSMWGGGDL
jgi:hypothetical protein